MKDLTEELLPKFLARISCVYVGDSPLTPNRMGYGRKKFPEPTITSASNSTLSGRQVTPVTRYSDVANPYKRKISFQSEGSEEGSSSPDSEGKSPVSDKEAKKEKAKREFQKQKLEKKQKLETNQELKKKKKKQLEIQEAKLDAIDHSFEDNEPGLLTMASQSTQVEQVLCCNIFIAT